MIRVEGLKKEFVSGRGKLQALRGVTFTVETGRTAVVYGKSGSGKSTLLNCVGGLEAIDSGKIICLGEELSALSAKELSRFQRTRLGFVFQRGNLLSCLNVLENIAFPLRLNNASCAETERRAAELLERVGLKGAEKAMPAELSGGEYQRVSVARAIAHRPGLLLADEPTASLDSATGKALIELMSSVGKENGCTTLISTHDNSIIELADLTIALKDGKMSV